MSNQSFSNDNANSNYWLSSRGLPVIYFNPQSSPPLAPLGKTLLWSNANDNDELYYNDMSITELSCGNIQFNSLVLYQINIVTAGMEYDIDPPTALRTRNNTYSSPSGGVMRFLGPRDRWNHIDFDLSFHCDKNCVLTLNLYVNGFLQGITRFTYRNSFDIHNLFINTISDVFADDDIYVTVVSDTSNVLLEINYFNMCCHSL